jgi:hypothetical protein
LPFLRNKQGKKRRVSIKPKAKFKFFKRIGLAAQGAQKYFFECVARFIILIAGSRFGKSWAAAMEVTAELVLLPQKTKKALLWWIACPTEDLGMLEFDYIYEMLIMANFEPITHVPDSKKRDRNKGYVHRVMSPRPTLVIYYPLVWGIRQTEASTLPGKSIVQVRTGRRGHEHNYLGREVDGVVFSECAQFPNLKYILEHRLFRATTTRRGRFLMPTTPAGLGYLKDEVYAWGMPGKKNREGWESLGPYKSTDGNMDEEEFQFWKRQMGEDTPGFQEQFLGIFTARSGRVYPAFLPDDKHIYTTADEKKFFARSRYCDHEILLGFDWGWENPSAVVFIAKVGSRYFVFDEIYGSHIATEDLADMVIEKLASWGIEFYDAYSDIDWQINHTMEQKGVFCMPARKHDKFSRREYMRQQFRVNDATGFSTIMFHERCRHSIREHLDYHMKEDQRDDMNLSEVPMEKDNHSCDALSYPIWTRAAHLWSGKAKEQVR